MALRITTRPRFPTNFLTDAPTPTTEALDSNQGVLDIGEIDFTPTTPRLDAAPYQPKTAEERKEQAGAAKQRGLGFDGQVLRQTIIKKLHEANRPELAAPLEQCHSQQFIKQCKNCRKTQTFYNRCENFYCPTCAARLANDKRRSVEFFTPRFTQPKHVVLTIRNTDTFSRQHVKRIKCAWGKLRRRKFAAKWRGGFYSLETTKENKGWHLHIHALVDANWIDQVELEREWADLVDQDFAIVKVKDARDQEYLRELCKYIVDGSALAKWTPAEIATYIDAFKGERTFGTFGTLYKMRAEFRTFLDHVQSDRDVCPCGCREFRVFDENEWEWYEATHQTGPPSQILESRGATPQKPGNPCPAFDL